MASTITSIDDSISKLTTTYQKAIKAQIEAESAPLNLVQTQKDSLDVRRGIYTDIKANFEALQSAVQALISTQATFGLKLNSKAGVTPGTAGTTVLTAAISNENITAADYDISVTQLAKAHSLASAAVASPDIALGKSGTFWLGGTGSAEVQTETEPGVYGSFVPSSTVLAAAAASVANGQRELGTGTYSLQVRDSGMVRQFRLVNADGNAVSIRKTDGTSGYTSEWQDMKNGAFDTGRGQTLTLDTDGSLESTSFHYNARGTSISIGVTDTQRTIAKAINAAAQPDGHDFHAAIIANRLVLTAAQTGENHAIAFSDGANLGLNTVLQAAQNAQFTLNGMSVSRASNTNLTDVVEGVTLSLAGDAEGKSARLGVTASADKATGLMNTLVSKFNAAVGHIKDKMTTTSKTENGKTSYTRGALSGETIFSSFRTDIMYRMGRGHTNTGNFKNLEEIGLSFDKDLKLTLDATKFSETLQNNSSDVTALLDASMGTINTMLSRFTGSSGTLARTLTSFDSQSKNYDQRILNYNASLELRKQALYKQYLEYQTQLVDLGNTAQMFGIDLGSVLDTSS